MTTSDALLYDDGDRWYVYDEGKLSVLRFHAPHMYHEPLRYEVTPARIVDGRVIVPERDADPVGYERAEHFLNLSVFVSVYEFNDMLVARQRMRDDR